MTKLNAPEWAISKILNKMQLNSNNEALKIR